jgi:inward rectifier potassium channel
MNRPRFGKTKRSNENAPPGGDNLVEPAWFAMGRKQRKESGAKMRVSSFGGYDLIKHGAARYDWGDPYHIAIDLSWKSFALAFVAAEVAINLVFAALYFARPGCIANAQPDSFFDVFFFSVETLATVGYGVMAPATLYGHAVSAIEIACGMAFTAIMTGLVFIRFSRPRPKILYANQAVVTSHKRPLTLMLRLANGRLTLLTHASVRLGILLYEKNAEGQSFRHLHELHLSISSRPFFPLTWTLMHQIDANSPLFGYDAERLAQSDAQLFMTIEARDHALSAFVYDLHIYSYADILFGMHYADVVRVDEQRRSVADLTRLSLLETDAVHAA